MKFILKYFYDCCTNQCSKFLTTSIFCLLAFDKNAYGLINPNYKEAGGVRTWTRPKGDAGGLIALVRCPVLASLAFFMPSRLNRIALPSIIQEVR